jgi:hypothetical protein
MSLAGGAPVRLTNDEQGAEFGSAWSPDGSRYIYLHYFAGKSSLMMVKTGGNATPVTLKKDVLLYLSDWSPAGDWITYRDEKGWNLVSPDGKTSKFLGNIDTPYLTFSKDGKLLYGIETSPTTVDRDRTTLFALDPASLTQKVVKDIGKEFRPAYIWRPGIRFSLASDGKSITYSTSKNRTDLWMLQGYRQPGWISQLTGK